MKFAYNKTLLKKKCKKMTSKCRQFVNVLLFHNYCLPVCE